LKSRQIVPPLKGGISQGLFLLLFLIILTSCALQPSKPEIAPKKFAEIYTALQITATRDSLNAMQVDSIIVAHGYTSAQFKHAAEYYNARAETWAEVLRHSMARLDSIVAQQTPKDSTSQTKPKE